MVDAKGFGKDARDFGSGISKKTIWIVIAAILVFVVWNIGKIFFEYVEIREIGDNYTSVFIKNLVVRTLVQAVSFAGLFLAVFVSILFVRRNLAVLKIQRAMFERLSVSMLICVVVAIILSGIVSESFWEKLLMFSNSQWFGKVDPVFGKDIGYYIFQRPFLESVTQSAFGVWFFVTAFILAIYWFLGTAFGGYSAKELFEFKRVVSHNIINIVILLAINCFTYVFKTESILYGSFGELQGAGYTARTIWLNFYRIAPILIVILCAFFIFFALKGRKKAAIRTVLIYPAVLIAVAVLAFGVQSILVAPNEVIKESENIKNNIEATQSAYGLEEISEVVFDAKDDLTIEDLNQHSEVTENIRILDLSANLTVLNQIQGIRNYYKFNETDIVPYEINGKKTAVAITPREITKENLSDSADTYINRTLRYTHGFGVTMNVINEVSSQGQPEFLIKDIPPKSAEGVQQIRQPRIYYGEITDDYVVVGNKKYKELDYSEDQEDIEFSYDGDGGVRLSPINRLIFAVKHGDIRLLISDLVSSNSRILINRNILERLERVAPFFDYDSDPYMVIDKDGGLKWIVDAYTKSDRYPYSQSADGFNYIRNSIKAVVDAYSGEVKIYIVDKTDPIANAYASIYPELFEKSEFPDDLKKHVKYPEYMFNIQAKVYGKYHISNPTVFYNKNDMWTIAKERYGTSNEEREISPYYNMTKLAGESGPELLLTIPYTIANKDNMVAWLAVRNEWDNYGKLQIYKFPKDVNIYGPMQVENRINSDMQISKELNLWSQGGSQVIRGNMIVVPIENSILYVEPIYIASSNKKTLPELKQIVVAYDEKIVMKSTLQDALYALFGERAPETNVEFVDKTEEDNNTELTYDEVAKLVIQQFENVKAASSANNWSEFGQSMNALEKSINELKGTITSE
ncbi:MAG: UPF0182 family protein [Clostridia bacterium]|nr:UPF0182 family protein [Clostridia bacterium]